MSEFVTGFLSELVKSAIEKSKLDEVLVKGESATLTRGDIYSYYLDPKVRKKLIPQLTERPTMVIQKFEEDEPVVRRKKPGKDQEITIEEGFKGESDPSDYMYWVSKRTIEFHPTHGETVDHLYVDIDPKGSVVWDRTKEVVRQVANALRKEPDVKSTRIVYSGGRGFHVKAKLSAETDTNKARERLKKALAPLTEEQADVTLGMAGSKQIRLDLSTLHDKGSLRAEYSINKDTGLVSLPVSNIAQFQKEDATIQKVMSKKQ
jgi:DNA primase